MAGFTPLEQIACWPWVEAVVILFGFAWGGMLGSFINVVVHRLPRGESVVTRRSRCPRCRSAIRPGDNVPVLGWLRLRGRCRDCGEPIAVSYPLVEGFCGLIVAVLAAGDLVAGGLWLAPAAGQGPPGIDRLLRGEWTLLLAFAVHVGVVLLITCWSLLDEDVRATSDALPEPLPAGGLWVPLGLVLVAVAIAPAVGPAGTGRREALVAASAGVLAGWLWGRLARVVAGPEHRSRFAGIGFGLPLLGSVLGWQMVTIVAVVTVALWSVCRRRWGGAAVPGLLLAVVATLAIAFQEPLRAAWRTVGQSWGGP